MEKFERPKYTVEAQVEEENYGKFVVSPLERGFGTTVGNAMRRVMLSSLPGGAVFSIKIDGVVHEFTTIKGVREDVALMILNIKKLILKVSDDDIYTLRVNAKGPCTVKAGDILLPAGVEVLNPELVIANLDDGAVLDMEMRARSGRGYISADENKSLFKGDTQGVGTIYTDSIFTPVVQMNFDVQPTRVGQSVKYDELTLEVTTNGSITPQESIALAAKILIDHFALLEQLQPGLEDEESLMQEYAYEKDSKALNMSIEDLELTVRSYNCLKRAGIASVEELTSRSEDEMSRVRNLGKKSLKEVKDKLAALGLTFRQS